MNITGRGLSPLGAAPHATTAAGPLHSCDRQQSERKVCRAEAAAPTLTLWLSLDWCCPKRIYHPARLGFIGKRVRMRALCHLTRS
jgi:hypothetical protein